MKIFAGATVSNEGGAGGIELAKLGDFCSWLNSRWGVWRWSLQFAASSVPTYDLCHRLSSLVARNRNCKCFLWMAPGGGRQQQWSQQDGSDARRSRLSHHCWVMKWLRRCCRHSGDGKSPSEWEILENLFFHLANRSSAVGFMSAARDRPLGTKVLMKHLYQHLWCSNFDSESGTGEEFSHSLKANSWRGSVRGRRKKKTRFLRNHEIVHPSNFPHQWVLIFDGARWRPSKVVRRARIFSLRCRHMVAPAEWKTAFHWPSFRTAKVVHRDYRPQARKLFFHPPPPTHLVRNKSNHNETDMQRGKYFRGEKIPQNVSFRRASHKKCLWNILMTSSMRKIIHEIKFFPSIPLFFCASAFFHVSSKRFGCECSGEGSLRAPASVLLRCGKAENVGTREREKSSDRMTSRRRRNSESSAICVMCGRRASSNFPSHVSQDAFGERVRPEISRKISGKRLSEGWRKNRIWKFRVEFIDFEESLASISSASEKFSEINHKIDRKFHFQARTGCDGQCRWHQQVINVACSARRRK